MQGLQLYARGHALVAPAASVAEQPRHDPAASRRSSFTSHEPAGRGGREAAGAARSLQGMRQPLAALAGRPASAPAVPAPSPALAQSAGHQAADAHPGSDRARAPGAACGPPAGVGARPGSAGLWASHPLAYPAGAAALVRRAAPRRLSPPAPARNKRAAPGAPQCQSPEGARSGDPAQAGNPVERGGGAALPSGPPSPSGQRPAESALRESARRPGTAPGAVFAWAGAQAQARAGVATAGGGARRGAATAAGSWRDPAHRRRVDRIRRQMLCAICRALPRFCRKPSALSSAAACFLWCWSSRCTLIVIQIQRTSLHKIMLKAFQSTPRSLHTTHVVVEFKMHCKLVASMQLLQCLRNACRSRHATWPLV
jgi:hypothetical protein